MGNTPEWLEQLYKQSKGRNLKQLSMFDDFYKETAVVKHDRFDERQFGEIRDAAEEIKKLIRDRVDDNPSWADLVRDDFLSLYKAVPEVNKAGEMKSTHAVNHTAMTKAMDTKEFEELRTYTELDEWASAMGAIEFATRIGDFFDEATEIKKAQDEINDADTKAQDALDDLKKAVDQEKNTEKKLDALEKAMQNYNNAAQNMNQTLQKNQNSIRQAAKQAANAGRQAAEEAESMVVSYGTDPGVLRRLPADERMKLANRIHRSHKLRELAKLVGRFKRFAFGEQARKVVHGFDELHDVTIGNDLSRVMTSELVWLADEDLENVFYKKLLDAELMQYELRGTEKQSRGAIICLIDNSGSMSGTREMWSKAIGLALLEIAHRQGRDFYGIHFSSGYDPMQEWYFEKGKTDNINDVLDFAEYFIGGGTDFELPLTRATEVLETQFNEEGSQKGDIVLITDGEAYVSDEFLERFNNAKDATGFRLYGLLIGSYGQVLDSLADTFMTITDLTKGNDARDVFAYI